MAIKKIKISPRQKMINLMYVVLMAMLALNISSEVLNGFSIVEESLNRTTANSSKENEVLYGNFAEQMKANPQKVKEWFEKATAVKRMSDSLYNFAQSLKEQIVLEADGKDGNIYDIIAGTFFLCGAPPDSEDFTSLTDEQLAHYTNRFRFIEFYIQSVHT